MSSIDVINLSILRLRMILMVIGNLKLCCQMFGLSPTSSRTLEKMLKLRQDKYSVQKQLMKKRKQNIQLTQSAQTHSDPCFYAKNDIFAIFCKISEQD